MALTTAVRPTTRGPDRPSHTRSRASRDNRAGYLFLLPWFVGFAFLVAGPMAASLYLSFTNFDLFDSPRWIGLANYTRMFLHDPRYLQSLKVTFIYVAVSVPLRLLVALALAVALNRGLRALGLYRAVFYVPSLLGGSVAVAVLWRQVFGGDGIVNRGLELFGFHGANWVADPNYALYTIVLLGIWQFGSPMVIFLAGLRQVPAEILEAATVDGAGRLRRLRSIVLPLLTPLIFFNIVFQTIVAFQAFTPAFIVSNGTGGPVDSTLFYTLYLYLQGFGQFHMGYASAMAWVLVLIIAAFTGFAFSTAKFWVFYGDESR